MTYQNPYSQVPGSTAGYTRPNNDLSSLAPPRRGPGPNAWQGDFLQGLIGILGQFPQASQEGMGILQSVLSGLGQQQAQRQAMTAAKRQQAIDVGSQMLLSGQYEPNQVGDVVSAASGLAGLGPKGQARVSDALSGFGPLMESPSELTPEIKAQIGSTLVSAASAVEGNLADDPEALYDMRQVARETALSLGLTPEGAQEAEDYAEEIYAQLAHVSREQANMMGRPGYQVPEVSAPSRPSLSRSSRSARAMPENYDPYAYMR